MRLQYVHILAFAAAAVITLPVLASQGRGSGQGRSSQSGQAIGPGQQGTGNSLRDQVYGWQLMTPAEREDFRNRMRSLKTPQERDALRMQHHEEMQKRAQERGVTLPDMPRRNQMGVAPAVQQRTEQQEEQQERNQQQQQQIQQKQRTQEQEQESGGHD